MVDWSYDFLLEASGSSISGGSNATSQSTKVPSLLNIPYYPAADNATQMNNSLIASNTDTLPIVVEFYKSEMVKLGWTDVSTPLVDGVKVPSI